MCNANTGLLPTSTKLQVVELRRLRCASGISFAQLDLRVVVVVMVAPGKSRIVLLVAYVADATNAPSPEPTPWPTLTTTEPTTTHEPTFEPTITLAPTRAPSRECRDDVTWSKRNEVVGKSCRWVAEFSSVRCSDSIYGVDGSSSRDACPFTCGTCSIPGCENDGEWFVDGQPHQNCESQLSCIQEPENRLVGRRVRRHPLQVRRWPSLRVASLYGRKPESHACHNPSQAAPHARRVLPSSRAATLTWVTTKMVRLHQARVSRCAGAPSKDCDWVSRLPSTRCLTKGWAGDFGYQGCACYSSQVSTRAQVLLNAASARENARLPVDLVFRPGFCDWSKKGRNAIQTGFRHT